MADFALSTAQVFLQKSLAQVVGKLRENTGRSEEEAIEQFLSDTRNELKSESESVQVVAVQKAAYFHMLGYDADYASFSAVRIMASTTFGSKRVGYVAACSTFMEGTPVIALMPQSLRRDLNSSNQYEVGLALYCIATICTRDIASTLVSDVWKLLSHPRSYVRKKAVLSLYKIFLHNPDSLASTYERLKEKLNDESPLCDKDNSVRGAVVCVLCELIRRNPANFTRLMQPFFSLLSNEQSNWALIKVIKAFGYFVPVEARLKKKLEAPLTKLITSSSAMSVQYECVLTIAKGMGTVPALAKLAADKLQIQVENADQNLKFLGLEAMAKLVRDAPQHLQDKRDTVLRCLDDSDVTIRCKALEVLRDLATKKNIVPTIDAMLDRCIRKEVDDFWSNAVIACIIDMAQTDDYELLRDFEWYLSVLLEISVMDIAEFEHGELVENEIVTILARLSETQRFGVTGLADILSNEHLLYGNRERSSQWNVLRAAAFACGEYPHCLENKKETCELLLSEAILRMPSDLQVICVTAVGKIAAYLHEPVSRQTRSTDEPGDLPPIEDSTTLEDLRASVCSGCFSPGQDISQLGKAGVAEGVGGAGAGVDGERDEGQLKGFLRSPFPEVQESAVLAMYLLASDPALGQKLYEEELLPPAFGAQGALELPDGLDLDKPFCENIGALMVLSDSDNMSGEEDADDGEADGFNLEYRIEQQKRLDRARREEMSAFYLRDDERSEGELINERGGLLQKGEKRPPSSSGDAWGGPGEKLPDSPSSRLRSRRLKGSTKAQNTMRGLVGPANFSPTGAGRRSSRRMGSQEADDATKKLRNIDVTRALSEREKDRESDVYALSLLQRNAADKIDSRGMPTHKGRGKAALSRSEATSVVLAEEKDVMRVTICVKGCKVKKDGTHLACCLEVVNLSFIDSIHEFAARVAQEGSDEASPYAGCAIALRAEKDAGESATKKPAENGRNDEAELHVEEKIRAGSTTRVPFTLCFSCLPPSFAAPLPLSLSYLKDNKRSSIQAELPMSFSFFAKAAPDSMKPSEFMESIMEGALHEAPLVSAFVPCSQTCMSMAVPIVQDQLMLTPVEVFKDAVTLYGSVHGRKGALELTHVGILLRESEEEGERGLSITVKMHSVCLGGLLVQDIASVVQRIVADA